MDSQDHPLILYTAQTQPVLDAISRDKTCFNRACYIEQKYQEVSSIFLTAYRQFVQEAVKKVPPPQGAEFPYWAFENPRDLYVSTDCKVLKLAVPRGEALLFDVRDWNKVLQFRFLGATEEEERAFEQDLTRRGITVWDVMNTNFYPDLRRRILKSWGRVLRHHEALCSGDRRGVSSVQAALWQIREEWIVEMR